MCCACRAATHDSKPCCARCLRRASSAGSGARESSVAPHTEHRTTNEKTRLKSINATPHTRDIKRHSVAARTTLPQIGDKRTRSPAPYPAAGQPHTRLGTYCDNLPGNCTPAMPASTCAAAHSNTHTRTLFQIRFSNSRRASVQKNPPEASGCALASVPSSCSCSCS